MTHDNYVYVLCDPDRIDPLGNFEHLPFYVGYGKKDRMYSHEKCAARILILSKKNSTYKNIILKRILDDGKSPIYVKLSENLSAQSAKELEREWISKIGRKDLGTGTLGNLTDGGDGISNISEETRQRMRDSHVGIIPSNIEQLKNHHKTLSKEELSAKMSKASLARNGGVKKPPRARKFPSLTLSEIATLRESNKTEEQKKAITAKANETKKNKPYLPAHNKAILNDSKEEADILFLFDLGVSAKNIHKIIDAKFSYDVVLGVIRRKLGDVKIYRRQTLDEALELIKDVENFKLI